MTFLASSTRLSSSYYYELSAMLKINVSEGFPSGSVVRNAPANAGNTGLIPSLGRTHMLQSNGVPQLTEPAV